MHQRFLIFLCFSAVLGLSGCDRQVSAFKDYLIEKKAEQGDAEAMYQLAMRLKSSDATRSFEWMLKAADAGHALAQEEAIDRFIRRESPFHDYDQAYAYSLKLAKTGNALAQSQLAWLLVNGYGAERNFSEGLQWYIQAAGQGHAYSMQYLGFMYFTGMGVAGDNQKAFQWFKKAAEKGQKESQLLLAHMYEQGVGTAANPAQAQHWFDAVAPYREQIEQGRSMIPEFDLDDSSIADRVKSQAEINRNSQGQPSAYFEQDSQPFYQLYNLALDYLHSSAGGSSHAQAFKILNQLDIHHEGVSYDLAEMYRQGLGTAQNAAKAAALYEQSHQAGNWQASYRLGEMYLNGASGIAQNDQKALYWFKEYQKKMPSGAGDKIALLYARNAHTPAEMKKAMQDLEKLAALGSQEAIFQLAQFYESGTGTAKNEEQALYWYKRLADRGNPQALEKMGDLYMKGAAGVIKDRQAAYDCYLQAAMRKNRAAEQKMLKLAETAPASQQFELAMSYAEGALSSSPLNQAETAEKLMNMAAAKGHQQARFYLESKRRPHQEAGRN
ncbi:MAG: tetratricopeptide repeat protein [Acinetobacter sp.]